MKKIQIELLHENGTPIDTAEISYLLIQPKMIIIDGRYFLQQFDGGTKYQETFPPVYKQKEQPKTHKMIISVDIETTKTVEEVKKALQRGIYRGLDTEPNYIAQPKNVKINYCQER